MLPGLLTVLPHDYEVNYGEQVFSAANRLTIHAVTRFISGNLSVQ
jgi:hypothetical protein